MRKVLYILGQLKDSDAEWMASVGVQRHLGENTRLIQAGTHPGHLYFLLSGRLSIVDASAGVINELGSGEIVGEMSFVDATPPQVDVIAGEDSVVLEISRKTLEFKINKDADFGLRFYRAMSIFLADRVRTTVSRLGNRDDRALQKNRIDELDDEMLDNIGQAGERFSRMLKTLSSLEVDA